MAWDGWANVDWPEGAVAPVEGEPFMAATASGDNCTLSPPCLGMLTCFVDAPDAGRAVIIWYEAAMLLLTFAMPIAYLRSPLLLNTSFKRIQNFCLKTCTAKLYRPLKKAYNNHDCGTE